MSSARDPLDVLIEKRKKLDESIATLAPKTGNPVCPHCHADPAPVMTAFLNQFGAEIAVFHCGACHMIHSVQMIGMKQQPQPDNRLVRPA